MDRDIIVMDDEDCVREVTCQLLEKFDLRSIPFSDGCSAIEYLRQRQESCLGYLVDMRVPCCLEGSEKLFNYIRDNNMGIENFYFMTGHLSGHDEDVIKRTHAECLLKPIPKDELLTVVEKMLERQRIHNYN